MAIWRIQATPEALNEHGRMTLIEHLGIEFLEIGEDFIRARMPVDHTTRTPAGILHGGASASLAETLGSVAANLCVESEKEILRGAGDKRQSHSPSRGRLRLRDNQAAPSGQYNADMGNPHFRRRGEACLHLQAHAGRSGERTPG